MKYDGWMVVEAFGLALPDLAAATKIWRRMYPVGRTTLARRPAVHEDAAGATARAFSARHPSLVAGTFLSARSGG